MRKGVKDSEFAKLAGADKPGRRRDKTFYLFFRHTKDKDIFGRWLYDDQVKRYVVIKALTKDEARTIAQLYRGGKYLNVMAADEEQELYMIMHPRIEQVGIESVDITANYWSIEQVDGVRVSNKMLRVQAEGSKSEVGKRIIAALVREFDSFKNKTQLVIHYDQLDASYIIVFKKTFEVFRVRQVEKAKISPQTEIIQT